MKISGIQKLSLVDYEGEVSTTIFTKGCNFRCDFCHNFEFVESDQESDLIDEVEVLDYIKENKSLLSAVVISGGEPTLQKDLYDFVKIVKSYGLKVKLDTNGSNPMIVIKMLEENLIDYVAMDIKTDISSYSDVVKVNANIDNIKLMVNYLINNNYNYEFRTTLIDEYHNNDCIKKIGEFIKGAKKVYLQHFELSSNVPNKMLHSVENKNTLEFKRILKKYVDNVYIRES